MNISENQKRDRVFVDKSQIEQYREMAVERRDTVERKDRESVSSPSLAFRSLKDSFVMAACIGFRLGKKKPLGNEPKELIWISYLKDPDWAILRAIAVCDKDDLNILANNDDVLSLAEEYANVGFAQLSDAVLSGGPQVENLVNYILENYDIPQGSNHTNVTDD
ncbi:MAG: hypothetical protein ABSH06_20565 [Thermodesulfobacteriota bacterium]